jgi:hypothetical protein
MASAVAGNCNRNCSLCRSLIAAEMFISVIEGGFKEWQIHVLTVTSRSSPDPGLELWPLNIVPSNIYVVFCLLTNLLAYVTAVCNLRIDFEGYGETTNVVQQRSSLGVSFCNCGPALILTISEGRWTLMDYHLLPAEVESWILPTLVSVSVVPSDWDCLDLRGPTG